MTALRRPPPIPARRSRSVVPVPDTGNTSRHPPPAPAAAGLAAARPRLGDTAGEGETARIHLAAGGDTDTWRDFPLGGLPAERPRLAALRAPVP